MKVERANFQFHVVAREDDLLVVVYKLTLFHVPLLKGGGEGGGGRMDRVFSAFRFFPFLHSETSVFLF